MNIKFKSVHIHHFLSMDDAEINLENRGYCLVNGINNNPKDAAKSNGSGKSSIWNAICYALTGETIQGLKSNLPNLYFNDGCWVELLFSVDKDKFKIIRSKEDKKLGTDLKVFINDKDESGKGIRESQEILNKSIPDITTDLIGSVIILGQGLPQKFSSNSPSGRKEVLEKLSKSDFMIEDLKNRISKRITLLTNKLRKEEDELLTYNTQLKLLTTQQLTAKYDLDNLLTKPVNEQDINNKNEIINKLNIIIQDNNVHLNSLNNTYSDLNSKMLIALSNKSDKLLSLQKQYNKHIQTFAEQKATLNTNINNLNKKIIELKSITDICPTCHQKISGVIKPDTTLQEKELLNYKKLLNDLNFNIDVDNKEYELIINKIENDFTKDNYINQNKIAELKNEIDNITSNINIKQMELSKTTIELNNLNNIKNNYNNKLNDFSNKLNNINKDIEEIKHKQNTKNQDKNNTQTHIEVINKMNTLIKRDFRGFLLTNVINFIQIKSKEYCKYVFNTDEINFKLDGNNINIEFCGKLYENLSGGEKQKVDLILQFAIRDMMCQYLNFSANILVLDEITDNLDSIGCDKVLNLINKELTDIESIFIISHRSDELSIPYDNIITVVKNEDSVSSI